MSEAMLRLARAVYGADAAWRDGSEPRVYVRKDYGAIEIFDPANNYEQAWEVLAWLLRVNAAAFDIDGHRVHGYVGANPITCKHNGTPSGIRAAVVEAAARVAGGGQ